MKRRNFVTLFFRPKKNGQISILMALIFPVLFVFFAMTINIGLVVHDKINLQTSADLAAYYAAQKQAEILNAIAHLNYQIRQNWKLLSFRINGFGAAGLGGGAQEDHPFRSDNRAYEGDWGLVPTVCTQFSDLWREKAYGDSDYVGLTDPANHCKAPERVIQTIPIPAIIPGILGQANQIAHDDTIRRLRHIAGACELHGTTNWIVAAMWIKAYKKALYYRKRAIKELADKLKDGKDLRGFNIEDGAYETFKNNLTRSNREAFDRNDFELFNSMEGIEWNEWLIERPLFAIVYYTDSEVTDRIEDDNKPLCDWKPKPHFEEPEHWERYNNFIPEVLADWRFYSQIESSPDSDGIDLNAILSYEKNPWYMVYSGVLVQTTPNEPFSPFVREPLVMKARAFAKPFGGKIGPWMYKSWPRGRGTSEGRPKVDELLPPIKDRNANFQLPNPLLVGEGYASPNYARYPGDQHGLRSFDSLRVYEDSMTPEKFSYGHFFDNQDFLPPDGLAVSENKFDPLVSQRNSRARLIEIMAISPDLFDITYYSIDPRFYINHSDISNPQLEFRRMTLDIGGSSDIAHYPPDSFGVIDQWAFANDLSKSIHTQGIASGYRPVGRVPAAKWFVTDWTHLLTGWVPDTEKQFGKCSNRGDLTLANRVNESLPGSCGIGGRMGYSVKIISRRYLISDLPLGGAGNTGKIMQQPTF